jgi:hypothetical protein
MTNAEPTNVPKPRRRWLRFSLRTLMVFVLFVSLGLGALTMFGIRRAV